MSLGKQLIVYLFYYISFNFICFNNYFSDILFSLQNGYINGGLLTWSVFRSCFGFQRSEKNGRSARLAETTINNVIIIIIIVTKEYIDFLKDIACTVSRWESAGKRIDIDKRKFFAVRKELFNFLLAHKKYFELNSIILMLEDLVIFKISTSVVADGEIFLR